MSPDRNGRGSNTEPYPAGNSDRKVGRKIWKVGRKYYFCMRKGQDYGKDGPAARFT